jgi:tetratricopeptide (TPR) repeat protein
VAGLALLISVGCQEERVSSLASEPPPPGEDRFTGSSGCRDCHEKFYELWAGSLHGLAMQPFTDEFARHNLSPQAQGLEIGGSRYRYALQEGAGLVVGAEPGGEKRYPIDHVLGGKNVFYFLTPMERGRLQVLPLAYDVRRKEWFDMAGSALRHFPDLADETLDWREREFTFNTACYSCHVSQLSTNYDLETDTYGTTWTEPGINCETCHGSGTEHVEAFREAPEGSKLPDLKIIRTKQFDVDQTNALCAPCHAKMIPMTTAYRPGERFFDHFDLVGLEDPDFHPDGRDLGENYTYTLWLTSPCARSGWLDCVHCHTPSGRYRFAGENANDACIPCHEDRVKNAAEHSRHTPGSPGSECVSCHMPETEFARMVRHDHSMRPPTPAATSAFGSPNACNLCHKDRDAVWADGIVREWRPRDYQAPVLYQAGLVDAARKEDWSRLEEMLDYLTREDRDDVYAASLIRLLEACPDDAKWPVILAAMKDRSPLVRASAARAAGEHLTPDGVRALLEAARDERRLVRVRAAAALAPVPPGTLGEKDRKALDRALAEFLTSLRARPDDAASHHNMGNFHMARNDAVKAIASFETAASLHPARVEPLVNLALAYSQAGRNAEAEESLRRALQVDPAGAAANFNLGLLLAGDGRMQEAEAALRTALKTDPALAPAAYNLAVIVAGEDLQEAIRWCRKASELRPDEPKYAFSLAFYQAQGGDTPAAINVLRRLIERHAGYADATLLLSDIHLRRGDVEEAAQVCRKALASGELSESDRHRIETQLASLSTP